MEEPKKKLVLIVEDEEDELEILVTEFKKAGFDVHSARDGDKALEAISQEKPNLILLDILMSGMDGWEVLRRVRDDGDWGKEVPVIILTNTEVDTDEMLRQIVKDEPAYFFVKTDFTIDQVLDKAKEVMMDADSKADTGSES